MVEFSPGIGELATANYYAYIVLFLCSKQTDLFFSVLKSSLALYVKQIPVSGGGLFFSPFRTREKAQNGGLSRAGRLRGAVFFLSI